MISWYSFARKWVIRCVLFLPSPTPPTEVLSARNSRTQSQLKDQMNRLELVVRVLAVNRNTLRRLLEPLAISWILESDPAPNLLLFSVAWLSGISLFTGHILPLVVLRLPTAATAKTTISPTSFGCRSNCSSAANSNVPRTPSVGRSPNGLLPLVTPPLGSCHSLACFASVPSFFC